MVLHKVESHLLSLHLDGNLEGDDHAGGAGSVPASSSLVIYMAACHLQPFGLKMTHAL